MRFFWLPKVRLARISNTEPCVVFHILGIAEERELQNMGKKGISSHRILE